MIMIMMKQNREEEPRPSSYTQDERTKSHDKKHVNSSIRQIQMLRKEPRHELTNPTQAVSWQANSSSSSYDKRRKSKVHVTVHPVAILRATLLTRQVATE